MNKKGQNVFLEVLIALAVGFTGLYTSYYAIAHWDMQCNILGQSHGYWCVIVLFALGIIFAIVGFYATYAMIRGKLGGPQVVPEYE